MVEGLLFLGKQKVFAKDGEGYLEHVRDWNEHRSDGNALFIVYEDLKKVKT